MYVCGSGALRMLVIVIGSATFINPHLIAEILGVNRAEADPREIG
jgi:hypothetical protein